MTPAPMSRPDAYAVALEASRADAERLASLVRRVFALVPDAADMLTGDACNSDLRRITARKVMADSLGALEDEAVAALCAHHALTQGAQP